MKTKQENGQGITPGNAFITRVQVSADAGQDYRGERDYRTVQSQTEYLKGTLGCQRQQGERQEP